MTLEINQSGARAGLHTSGALWLPEHHTVLVADAHVGKAVSFRKLGVPVPSGTTTETLNRLTGLLHDTQAQRLVFLGDFLHSARSHAHATLASLAAWRAQHAQLAITLIRGNHDDRAGDPPASLNIDVVNEPLPLGPFALCHHPQTVAGAYVLAGHWHPCTTVYGRARQRLRLPCFWMGAQMGVLPAFGAFTGMHPIKRQPGDRVFAIADDVVRQLNALA